MTDGYFVVRTGVYNSAMPVPGARVYIRPSRGAEFSSLSYDPATDVSETNYDRYTVTGGDGKTGAIRLAAPSVEYSFGQAEAGKAYNPFDVLVLAEGFVPVFVRGFQVFPGIQSELPLNLEPYVSDFGKDLVKTYIVPRSAAVDATERRQENGGDGLVTDILSEVVIPSTITVHLGTPSDTSAENVTVPFAEYIKNVASSEIFPTWDEEAIRANIYAQISFALNRIYTEWYRSRGYPYDITNSTTVDQSFVEGRNIYDNISRTVDDIFNVFIRKDGNYEPFFARYCDGIRTTCDGLSQWGSQRLAERGYNAIAILRNYYGDTVELSSTDNIADSPSSYPGTPLSLGSVGQDVLEMQIQLDRIRRDYPAIPAITRLNGRFGTETDSAVRSFQNIFNLTVDGIVGKATWYKISRIYSAVTKLGEITSEGTETFISDEIPSEILNVGSSGDNTRLLQFILEYLSFFYPTIPETTVDGYFGEDTKNAVIGFQRTFGLETDGVVGEATWNALYSVSREINDAVKQQGEDQRYPGIPLSQGDTGEGVELMKRYYNIIAQYYGELPTVQVNNTFDAGFADAIREFQRNYDLDPDGVIGALTWTRIVEIVNFINNMRQRETSTSASTAVSENRHEPYPGIILRRGANGRHVKYIQNALNVISKREGKKRYIPISGEFDSGTELAVMEYQRDRGLSRNGAVDRELWDTMMSDSAGMGDIFT